MPSSENYNVYYTSEAQSDYADILYRFAEMGSKQGAERIRRKVNKAAALLKDFPYIGAAASDDFLAASAFRVFVIEDHLMFYKVFEEEKQVVIMRILNGRTDYCSLLYENGISDDTENEEEK